MNGQIPYVLIWKYLRYVKWKKRIKQHISAVFKVWYKDPWGCRRPFQRVCKVLQLCVYMRPYFLLSFNQKQKTRENGIETCKISCMKRVASPGLMHDAGCLGLVHWTQRDGTGREDGGRVRDGEHMCTCGGFMLMYGKINTIL